MLGYVKNLEIVKCDEQILINNLGELLCIPTVFRTANHKFHTSVTFFPITKYTSYN